MRMRNRKQLSWHLKGVNKNRIGKTVDPLPLQNQGNSQKSIGMSCKMLDYWMLSRNIWKPPKPNIWKPPKPGKKTRKTCQKHAKTSACRTPSVESMRSNRQQRLTAPRSAPSNRQQGQINSIFRRLSTILESHDHPHVSIIGSHQAKKANLEILKWQKCDCHNLPNPLREIGSWPQIRSCRLIRKFRNRDQLASPAADVSTDVSICQKPLRWCGDVGYRSSNGRWILTCNMICNITYPHIQKDIWAFPFRHGGTPGTIIHLN